jgi:glycosyltransferase involved in cell wall biosynthesis
MRILYLINSLSAGGAEIHLLALTREMIQRGHTVHLCVLTNKTVGGSRNLTQEFIQTGTKLTFLSDSIANKLHEVVRWIRLYRLVKKYQPDLLHSHLPRSDFAAVLIKKVFPRCVWICTLHDAHIKGNYSGYWIFHYLSQVWRVSDHVIAVSSAVSDWAALQIKISANKMSVIHHGIQCQGISTVEQRSVSTVDPRHRYISCLARYEPRKGIEYLIRAMPKILSHVPNARLIVAGSNPNAYKECLLSLAIELKVDPYISFQDFCEDPVNFLAASEMFAFASISEGFGLVLLEAMRAGLPIVASNIEPINQIVLQNKTGLLVEPKDPSAFADAIVHILKNPQIGQRMGQEGHHRCVSHFSEEVMANTVEDLYLQLFEQHK